MTLADLLELVSVIPPERHAQIRVYVRVDSGTSDGAFSGEAKTITVGPNDTICINAEDE